MDILSGRAFQGRAGVGKYKSVWGCYRESCNWIVVVFLNRATWSSRWARYLGVLSGYNPCLPPVIGTSTVSRHVSALLPALFHATCCPAPLPALLFSIVVQHRLPNTRTVLPVAILAPAFPVVRFAQRFKRKISFLVLSSWSSERCHVRAPLHSRRQRGSAGSSGLETCRRRAVAAAAAGAAATAQ